MRLFHRRADTTGNALSPTAQGRTAKDVDEVERLQCLLVVVVQTVLTLVHQLEQRPCRKSTEQPWASEAG